MENFIFCAAFTEDTSIANIWYEPASFDTCGKSVLENRNTSGPKIDPGSVTKFKKSKDKDNQYFWAK